ncbi:hypothetical protein QBC47DRAFT_370414 [Echria macrotheca]|uniref:Uncharacterized protein n=1 Tax=Echria macrotheca TaxID=438768 RepID=A0AAJ0BNH9_9PEZI|nr:hypothetical protein QBC47DRAFT_370414 [Echria macrotheca]
MAPIATLLNFAIAGTSGYSLYHSMQSIPNLRKYKDKAEKAAKGSSTAEKRLGDTRYTVAAGVAISVISFLGALHRLVFASTAPTQRVFGLLWLVVLCLGEFAVGGYIQSFWADEKRVLLTDEYNESVSHHMEVMRLCDDLACLWAVATVLAFLGY